MGPAPFYYLEIEQGVADRDVHRDPAKLRRVQMGPTSDVPILRRYRYVASTR